MAIVPPFAKQGDQICIIFGAQTPFVLREWEREIPAGDDHTGSQDEAEYKCQYKLVGECYVHGIMDGEMMTRSGEKMKQFVLC
jgi:hypothetical protein